MAGELENSIEAAIDPVEQLIGAIASEVPDWTTQPDKYLGQTLLEEMRGTAGTGG